MHIELPKEAKPFALRDELMKKHGVCRDSNTSSLYWKIVPLEIGFNISYLPDMTISLQAVRAAFVSSSVAMKHE